MKISDLLCSSVEVEDKEESPSNQESQVHSLTLKTSRPPRPQKTKLSGMTVIPDNQRKRPYRMTPATRAYEDYESRVFNLTLDNNQLRQQVQYLLECRDLHLTRLFVYRQQFEGDVLRMAKTLVNGFSDRGPGLTSNASSRQQMIGSKSNEGVRNLVLERGKHIFSHRSWTTTSIQMVCFVEDNEDKVAAEGAEIRRLCGGSNGCVVEVIGISTGRIKREMLAAFYPHVLHDEAFVARMIGFVVTCPVRLILYFDSNRHMTHQVAQVDVLASMEPLHQTRPRDFDQLMNRR
ncbi:Hypothetical protein PHPALM_3914 [Phytophthora palmivora]|uniref:Uncharacterized protein n=1 Tax=Phytophthora palmivora TaxID=4796 RepID=A0A2P4YLD9_9STRA|nr:Hypothetical protein PHPALM_3914 [Phytophthora palmivora]